MTPWRPQKKHLKGYPHFDGVMTLDEIEAFVNDPAAVTSHPFYPFIEYEKKWQPFRHADKKPAAKLRRIRYAARSDAYIFMRYRQFLSERYEALLKVLGLSDCILAYRRIPVGEGKAGGKCNIHFAKAAFEAILWLGNCCAVAVDISSYFDSLDHRRLKKIWCEVMGLSELPPDHYAVFKAITRFSVVSRNGVYARLGYFGEKRRSKTGKPILGFLRPVKFMPARLCSLKDFKQKVCGEDPAFSDLTNVNGRDFGIPGTGIPQGSPISDLLANMYLVDFDRRVAEVVRAGGGFYFRYSDDILIIMPSDAATARTLRTWLGTLIREYGDHLLIKDSKTSLAEFRRDGDRLVHCLVDDTQGRNGLEYLGFRFDGELAFIRDATLSGLARKVSAAARASGMRMVARYPGKDLKWLVDHFNYEELTKKFGRVEQFEEVCDKKSWTFWTYVQRASEVFGPLGVRIIHQANGIQRLVRRRAVAAIEKAYNKRPVAS